jgi:thiol-disulfide isomerase/thioredoxin
MSWFSRRTAIVLLLGAVLAGCNGLNSTSESSVAVGAKAPAITGTDLDGKSLDLSEYRGKVVMLSFWASWCGPCRDLFPHERSLVERYQGKPFVLLGVNEDQKIESARRLMEKGDVVWRSFADGDSGTLSHTFGVDALPSVFIIDHNGVLQYKTRGVSPETEHEIDKTIARLVADAEVGK